MKDVDTQLLALLRSMSTLADSDSTTYKNLKEETEQLLAESNSSTRSFFMSLAVVLNALIFTTLMIAIFPVTMAVAIIKPNFIEQAFSWVYDTFSKSLDLSSFDKHGLSALHYAATIGDANLASDLLSLEPQAVDYHSREKIFYKGIELSAGLTPLHIAAIYGKPEMVDKLLMVSPDQIFKSDDAGFTPAHYAAMFNHPALLNILLPHGSPSLLHAALERKTNDFRTILTLAAEYDAVAVLEALENGFEPDMKKADFTGFDVLGWTPLHHAARFGAAHSATWLMQHGAKDSYVQDCRDKSLRDRAESFMFSWPSLNTKALQIASRCAIFPAYQMSTPDNPKERSKERYLETSNVIKRKPVGS